MMRSYAFSILPFLIGVAFFPALASAATSFEVSGWMPYWRVASSTLDVAPHLSELTEINPFVYTLGSNGGIIDNGHMDQEPWTSLLTAARMQHVRVIPTIMTSNGDLVHALLSHSSTRIALEKRIADFVRAKGYDGIEIDFEGKHAADKNYFSLFLKGLYERMGNKWVMCDIEARTPIADRYYGTSIPADAGMYANDFTAINKYCDRVKLMTYDQQSVDQKLAAEAASSSTLYAPIADPAWVTQVVDLASRYISKSKIMIGIPTYGYEYDVTAYANNEYNYDILWTFNPTYASDVAKQFGVTPTRAPWGEMELTHINYGSGASTTPPASLGFSSYAGLAAAAAASTYATQNNSHLDFRMLVWPDAQSIAGKVELAQQLGVRGVAIFKLDGGEDQGLWTAIDGAKSSPIYSSASVQNPPLLTRGLGLGSTGQEVRTLQTMLNSDPATEVAQSGVGSPGRETNLFGPATEAAVRKFQMRYSIAKPGDTGYGYVGPATRGKLNALYAG